MIFRQRSRKQGTDHDGVTRRAPAMPASPQSESPADHENDLIRVPLERLIRSHPDVPVIESGLIGAGGVLCVMLDGDPARIRIPEAARPDPAGVGVGGGRDSAPLDSTRCCALCRARGCGAEAANDSLEVQRLALLSEVELEADHSGEVVDVDIKRRIVEIQQCS